MAGFESGASIATLCCCAPVRRSVAGAQSMDRLYERAKAEGTVALYGAGPPEPYRRWIADFQKDYPGVTVDFTGGLSNALDKKIEAAARRREDGSRRRHSPDHAGFGALEAARRAAAVQAGWICDDRPGVQGRGRRLHHRLRQHDHLRVQHRAASRRPTVPKSAADFLKPMFSGKLITTDPTDDDAGFMAFYAIVEKIRLGVHGQIPGAAAALHATRPCRGVERHRRGRDAGDIRFDLDHAAAHRARASRSRWCCRRTIRRRCFWSLAAIFKDAPHPNAAKLFLDWYLAPDQQRRNGAFSARSDVAPPPGWRAAVELQARPQLPRAALRRGETCRVETDAWQLRRAALKEPAFPRAPPPARGRPIRAEPGSGGGSSALRRRRGLTPTRLAALAILPLSGGGMRGGIGRAMRLRIGSYRPGALTPRAKGLN